ncbi:response regulator transcription factor [Zafaria sp. Z1313]|uniref:response regulator transcription factor n=1 Tax=unclassified Zafaria TaxID=2828765 RepID=UPI002E77ACB3|nr:response regulator transcription factor [Zafaria sp. J156]MEE1621041.1 response regulator transcription factor [Zafaria sp. J156]
MRVLVCEDDDGVARGLSRALTRAGYHVVRAATVADAFERIAEGAPDIALVDLGLPDGSGTAVVKALRSHPATAVIVVTAHGREQDRVVGLRAGADDYVVKPFSVAELLARIEAVSRRTLAARAATAARDGAEHPVGPLVLRTAARELVDEAGAGVVPLTAKESAILALLAASGGEAVPREFLIESVWETVPDAGASRSLDTHMAALRAKLRGYAVITTIRGLGYRLGDADPAP